MDRILWGHPDWLELERLSTNPDPDVQYLLGLLVAEREAAELKALNERPGPKRFGTKPGEKIKVRKIVELRGQGMSFPKIAATLNEMGWRTARGKRWRPGAVHRVVQGAGT